MTRTRYSMRSEASNRLGRDRRFQPDTPRRPQPLGWPDRHAEVRGGPRRRRVPTARRSAGPLSRVPRHRDAPTWVERAARLGLLHADGPALSPPGDPAGFARVLGEAKLPGHFTPHSLRHTFASLLLRDGVSPAYVQRQLGHSSIKLTVDLYGKWLPMANKAAVDRLDDATPTQVVADVVAGGSPLPCALAVRR